ncbi:MAG: septal ring lytic transglycosylase RlpA family protein [Methylococcales bacterium]|nr:septal ring lytic transglycosylase RlpA family protein [Methylococcales bacterium]
MIMLVSCSTGRSPVDGPPERLPVDIDQIPDAVPRHEPRTRAGNPKQYQVFGKTYHVLPSSSGYVEQGRASWYGKGFHGKSTANGERYDMFKMTAAHKTLPIPSYVEVINLENGRRVVVRINDRGPFHDGRVIDLSYVAALKLGITQAGTGRVRVRALEPGDTPVQQKPEEHWAAGVYVQLGAFQQRANAERFLTRFNHLPLNKLRINHEPDSGWHKVQAGPLSTHEADALVARLSSYGLRPLIVPVNAY